MNDVAIQKYWRRMCVGVMMVTAIVSYCMLAGYSSESLQDIKQSIFVGAFGFFVGSFFVVLVAVLALPHRNMILLCQIHLACFSYFLLLDGVNFSVSVNHGSPGDFLAAVIRTALYIMLLVELMVIALAVMWGKRRGYAPASLGGTMVVSTFLGALVAGSVVALLLWSFRMQPIVLSQAENVADGRPYCIEAASENVESLLGVNAINLFARAHKGYAWYFHGLLVVADEKGQEYWNWSYRYNTFFPVSERAWRGMRMDETPRCTPQEQWGNHLPLW